MSTPLPAGSIDVSTHPLPFPLHSWIDSHKSLLQPPVNNAMIYGQGAQFKLMVIGGPNLRTDFHINQGEEWFHQLKGDMVLKVVDGGTIKDVVIREGDVFLLPPNVPHSPQRLADTLGLVMEREREEAELDGLRWYCQCMEVVYEEFFHCEDLGKQLKEKITAYYGDVEKRTCKRCGAVDQPPNFNKQAAKTVEDIIAFTRRQPNLPQNDSPTPSTPSLSIDHSSFHSAIVPSTTRTSVPPHTSIDLSTHPVPFSLTQYIAQHESSLRPPVSNKLLYGGLDCEYQIQIVGGPNNRTDYHIEDGEEWFYQLKGDMLLKVVDGGQPKDIHIRQGESFLLPPHVPHSPQRFADTVGLVIERRRKEGWDDGLRWYCRNVGCGSVVFEDRFKCVDLGSQVKVAIEEYYGNETKRTCAKCGTVDEPPAKAVSAPASASASPTQESKEHEESKESKEG